MNDEIPIIEHDDHFYNERIIQRNWGRLILGLFPRIKVYLFQAYCRHVARSHGATVGKYSVIPYSLAKKANKNLIVGEHCCISTSDIDLRAKVEIGNYVAFSRTVRILRASHDVDSPLFTTLYYDLKIDDYVWLVGCLILPRVTHIACGAVCGCGSVVTRNVPEMALVGGNPAQELRKRKCVASAYCLEDLRGGDFPRYWQCLKTKWKNRS